MRSTRVVFSLGVAMAVLWTTLATLASTSVQSYLAETSNPSFTVGNISGDTGYQGSGTPTGSGGKIEAPYGYKAAGETCSGSQSPDPHEVTNKLRVTLVFTAADEEGSGPYTVNVNATSYIGEKQSGCQTQEIECPTGSPAWSIQSSIKMKKPAVGTNPGTTGAGGLSQSFTASSQGWTLRWDSNPQPPGYANESFAMDEHTWSPNPALPDTMVLRVTAAAIAKVENVSASEIRVLTSYSKATCGLEVTYWCLVQADLVRRPRREQCSSS